MNKMTEIRAEHSDAVVADMFGLAREIDEE
jgi:hypothetical protein